MCGAIKERVTTREWVGIVKREKERGGEGDRLKRSVSGLTFGHRRTDLWLL